MRTLNEAMYLRRNFVQRRGRGKTIAWLCTCVLLLCSRPVHAVYVLVHAMYAYPVVQTVYTGFLCLRVFSYDDCVSVTISRLALPFELLTLSVPQNVESRAIRQQAHLARQGSTLEGDEGRRPRVGAARQDDRRLEDAKGRADKMYAPEIMHSEILFD